MIRVVVSKGGSDANKIVADILVSWQRLIENYREKNYAHERMVGELLDLLNNDDLDGAREIVKNEYDAIHGPSD